MEGTPGKGSGMARNQLMGHPPPREAGCLGRWGKAVVPAALPHADEGGGVQVAARRDPLGPQVPGGGDSLDDLQGRHSPAHKGKIK